MRSYSRHIRRRDRYNVLVRSCGVESSSEGNRDICTTFILISVKLNRILPNMRSIDKMECNYKVIEIEHPLCATIQSILILFINS
jgi:hypothetical protein